MGADSSYDGHREFFWMRTNFVGDILNMKAEKQVKVGDVQKSSDANNSFRQVSRKASKQPRPT